MENSKNNFPGSYHSEKDAEIFEELFNLSRALRELNLMINKQIEQIKSNPVSISIRNHAQPNKE